jgi:predicted phosphodiesterase
VLVGDIFQADWGWRVGPQRSEVDTILARFSRLWREWSSPFFLLLAGNHDCVTREHLAARESARLGSDGVNVFYLHGDSYDITIRGELPNFVMWTVGRLRIAGLRRTADFLEDYPMQFGADWVNGGDPIQREALGLGVRNACNVVVAGHTHGPRCEKISDVVYANSGAFTPDHMVYVSIDTLEKSVRLVRYDRSGRESVLREVAV